MISKLTFYLKLGFKFPKFSDVFLPVQTDLIPFPLVHISHQDLLNKMLKDHDVDVLSAISCFIYRNFTCIRDYFRQKFSLIFTWPTQTLFLSGKRNLRTFSHGRFMKTGWIHTGNSQQPVHNFQKSDPKVLVEDRQSKTGSNSSGSFCGLATILCIFDEENFLNRGLGPIRTR